ncbi:molybdopterin molybdotransferase MoeA [soil metagenome]
MIDVSAALEIVLRHAKVLTPEVTAVMSSSLGQVVSESVPADLDSPPFDKSMMDGYAIRIADASQELRDVGEIAAGTVSNHTLQAGEAIRIFTGAPIPDGADCVVMHERTTLANDLVRVNDPTLTAGRNIIRRGAEMKAGDAVILPGTLLTPATFGVLSSVGRTRVQAYPRPKVVVLATGDELVEPNRTPRPGQIRNSNGPMLMAQADRAGALPRYLGIAPDTEAALRSFIGEGLEIGDVVVMAGGVSAGKLDLVPKVLTDLGVTTHFHHVRMKPGKPLLFGTKGDVMIFGLPGNPVSAFLGFELFVKPLLKVMAGHPAPQHQTTKLPLTAPLASNHDRPTYHPAKLVDGGVQPLSWFGSADLRGLLSADAFVLLSPGVVKYEAGDAVDVMSIGN